MCVCARITPLIVHAPSWAITQRRIIGNQRRVVQVIDCDIPQAHRASRLLSRNMQRRRGWNARKKGVALASWYFLSISSLDRPRIHKRKHWSVMTSKRRTHVGVENCSHLHVMHQATWICIESCLSDPWLGHDYCQIKLTSQTVKCPWTSHKARACEATWKAWASLGPNNGLQRAIVDTPIRGRAGYGWNA